MTISDTIPKSTTPAALQGRRPVKKSDLLLVIVGVGLFAWVIRHVGTAAIIHQLKALRIALPIVIVLSLVRLLLQTLSWSTALKSEGLQVGFLRLMGIRVASQSMGYLTIFGPVISEPMKIRLLRTPVAKTATATFLDNGVYWFTSALIGIAGCLCISLIRSHGGMSARVFSLVFAGVMVFFARKTSVLAGVTSVLGKRSPSWLNKAAKAESAIREVRAQKPELVGKMFWLSIACQLLLVLEVAVVLWALRLAIHPLMVLAIEGLTRSVKLLTGFVPARLGADESGAMSAFAASGLMPAFGLALALTRRARDLAWCVVGLSWLAWTSQISTENKAVHETL